MSGSKGARASPDLIAACHVFHRLSMPRHPSEALMRLIVLSKTHAWGRFVLWPYEIAKAAPTHALCFDVFSGRPYKPQGRPGKPFNSQCHSPAQIRPEPETLFHDRLPFSCCSATLLRQGFGGHFVYAQRKPKWWSQTGSNRRPHACKARALPTELWPLNLKPRPLGSLSSTCPPEDHTKCGGPRQTRTADLTLIRRVL